MRTDYVVKRIYSSGATSTIGHHNNPKDAKTEANFRHAAEPLTECLARRANIAAILNTGDCYG